MPSLLDVTVADLHAHTDARGSLVAFEAADAAPTPLQWNHVCSKANVLRGIHVHRTRWDFLYLLSGEMALTLVDARRDSRDFAQASVIHLRGARPQRVCIPPGIAHAFLFSEDSVLLQGMSHLWDPADELGCRWDTPELNIQWSAANPVLSGRDASAGTFDAMVRAFDQRPQSSQ